MYNTNQIYYFLVKIILQYLLLDKYLQLLPLLWVYRGANFTESQVNDFFGPLKIAISAKSWIRWIGITLGTILLIISALIYYFKIKKAKTKTE